ncbi:AAA family ATPase [Annulohypoxylon moriforme]|nr:AAA family ATPase [Annulohypoxylon moriforme]
MSPIAGTNGPNQNHRRGSETGASVSGQSLLDTGERETVSQDATLSSALDVISRALNLYGQSALTMEKLQSIVSTLQEKRDPEIPSHPRAQIVHRVSTEYGQRMYLDKPQWVEGASSFRGAPVGTRPVPDIPTYLFKHSDICFLVYRDYNFSISGRGDSKQEYQNSQSSLKHNAETITPVTEELLAAVESFLEHYNFLNTIEPSKLSAPYCALYHTRGDDLKEFMKTLDDEPQRQFQALLDYVYSEYAEEYSAVDEITNRGKITYAYIQYLFKPGDVVVNLDSHNSQGYICKNWLERPLVNISSKVSGKKSTIQTRILNCWNWAFDGIFSRQSVDLSLTFDINDQSERNIDDLDIRPLKYVNEETKSRLESRGKWVWRFRVRCLVSYCEMDARFYGFTRGRYMIDMMMYRELCNDKHNSQNRPTTIDQLGPDILRKHNPPDIGLIYAMPKMIKGFNLKRKKWVDLEVDRIEEVVWDKEAFDNLVLDEDTKNMIQAMISNKIETEMSTDLIRGKGNGLILLLHGGPGTGKTLTAESVAEVVEKPLYAVTCGDIGTEPESVETYLESVLHIGKTWGCIVLLDEADVFLEQRDLNNPRRNALVSIFLRAFEYYEGILILTSNRVDIFDKAFQSRIHLAVHYHDLTSNQRKEIWRNFIKHLERLHEGGIDIEELYIYLDELAKHEINGREIRNIITTARQYVRWQRDELKKRELKLNYKVMDDVLQTTQKFNQYTREITWARERPESTGGGLTGNVLE